MVADRSADLTPLHPIESFCRVPAVADAASSAEVFVAAWQVGFEGLLQLRDNQIFVVPRISNELGALTLSHWQQGIGAALLRATFWRSFARSARRRHACG